MISKIRIHSACVALACVVLSAVASPARAQEGVDTVALKDGTPPLVGKLKDSEVSGLTIEVDGKSKKVAWADVQSVSFGEAPDLAPALASLNAGRLEEALAPLETLAGEKLSGPLQQEVHFHLGWIQQGLGELVPAIATYRKLLADHPRGRYLRLASENLIACLSANKADGDVAAELDKLATAAGDAAADVELVRAHYLESQGRADDARKAFEALQGNPQPAIAAEARLGLARAAMRAGKRAEAETTFKEITLSAAPPTVLAGAWNGLGELFAEDGKKNRDHEKLMDAAFMYLRGVVQYKPRLGESSVEYERALAGAARCFKYISELETNPERKKLFASRATERSNQLRAEFPQSIYLEN